MLLVCSVRRLNQIHRITPESQVIRYRWVGKRSIEKALNHWTIILCSHPAMRWEASLYKDKRSLNEKCDAQLFIIPHCFDSVGFLYYHIFLQYPTIWVLFVGNNFIPLKCLWGRNLKDLHMKVFSHCPLLKMWKFSITMGRYGRHSFLFRLWLGVQNSSVCRYPISIRVWGLHRYHCQGLSTTFSRRYEQPHTFFVYIIHSWGWSADCKVIWNLTLASISQWGMNPHK